MKDNEIEQLELFEKDNLSKLKTKKDYNKFLKNYNILKNDAIKVIEKSEFKDINVRLIKLLGSKKDINLVSFFLKIIDNSEKTYSNEERREAVSSIGRMRNKEICKKYLLPLIHDNNPEIALQALRALLIFKNDEDIEKILIEAYKKSSNEIIKDVLDVEFKFNELDFDTPTSHIMVDSQYKNKVIKGDALKYLENMEKNKIHLTFTSPPYYNARDYSIYSSYNEYLNFLENVFKEIHRVTKDGRFLIVNTSPIIIPRAGRKYSSKRYPIPFDLHNRIIKNGWEFIDDIIWKKSEASVKNRIGNFMQHRKPLSYKPNTVTEYIMVYRKKSHKLLDWNLKSYPDEIIEKSLVQEDYESSNVWNIEPSIDKIHTAVFPEELCKNIINYYSLEGDLIFDPFGGSGTLGKVALENNRNILMTEINNEYYCRIQENLKTYNNMVEYIDYINIPD